jgi:hypothetical protein
MICEQCNCEVKPFEGVHLTVADGSVFLCSKCYNQRAAEYAGVDFTHVSFEPESFKDTDGQEHVFHFTTHLFGDRISMEAVEKMEDDDVEGYRFCLIGDVEGGVPNVFNLFGQLIARIKRGLSRKHLEHGNYGRDQITDEGVVRGHITSDIKTSSRLPILVIDGHEVSWHDFGDMVMTYEGFNFRLELIDRADEA